MTCSIMQYQVVQTTIFLKSQQLEIYMFHTENMYI